ncbi:MAG: thiamine pyrophosphate-dependent enzyme [Candidatus Omnitrophica bacterium]|nr:thiamine pyrophosphate-dependent enzyme [Candidatus Omnitrophota bacterium]
MMNKDLGTYAPNTWCPGCGNFAILTAIKTVLKILSEEGLPLENIVLVSGIGCHAKIVDYVNVNSFYSIHGRVTPVAEAIKLANPKIKVIGFAGDGDAYGEGLEHLVFAAKRNIDITMIIHNNRVYGLTTGQYTPTSPLGFKGRSTPQGTVELPINPLELMLSSGASFIARAFSHGLELLKKIFKEAILHKGFSLVDVLQVCVTFYNMYEYYDKRVYELKEHNPKDFDSALKKIREWDYNSDASIALGIFYRKEIPTFEERVSEQLPQEQRARDLKIKEILKASL